MKIRIPKRDPIEFLIRRKYPTSIVMDVPLSLTGNNHGGMSYQDRENLKKKVDEYKAELLKLSADELESLVQSELEKDTRKREAEAAEVESARPYNLFITDADYDHWSKTAYWTLEEAVALSFGKNPDLVNWTKLKDYTTYPASPFIDKYRKTLELARRAKVAKQISDPVWPGTFITWANRNGLSFPQELVGKVESHGHATPDWKDYYDQLKTQHETLEKDHALLKEKLNQLSSDTTQLDRVLGSNYFRKFLGKIKRAIEEYPSWRNAQKSKVQKTGNLHDWLTKKICLNNREAEMAKQIMSDIFKDLQ